MTMNYDDHILPEWIALGTELLDGSMVTAAYEEGMRLLQTPGVDPALYMLFCSLPQGFECATNRHPTGVWSVTEIRSLMQCAFMLGSYVKKSIEDVEKLW